MSQENELQISTPMIKKLMDVCGSNALSKEVMKALAIASSNLLKLQLTEEEIQQIVEMELDNKEFLNEITKIYAEHLSANDILNMISFYKSSTGKNYIKYQIDINTKIANFYVNISQKIVEQLCYKSLKNIKGDQLPLD